MLAGALAAAAAAAYSWMFLLWIVSLIRRDSSIVDPAWGVSFVIAAAAATTVEAAWARPQALLILALLALWGFRLSGFLLVRNLGHGEDPRYAAWREQHGSRWWWRSLFQVFLLQGTILLIVSLVTIQPISEGDSPNWLAFVGAAVVVAGILIEAVSDAQLARFRRDASKRGQVLDSGLWKFSRHPNYFGESVVWWGFWFVALGSGGAWWTVVSPLLMTWLLLKVSGVPMLEKRLESTRPGYAEYARKTSAFVLWPQRKA